MEYFAIRRGQGMTNKEKLSEVFPNTIFIYQKQDDKTRAIMCSDEWLDDEYQDNNQNKRADQEPKWILLSERLPKEGINPITQDYYEYQCSIYLNGVYDLRFLRFGKGHWWNGGWLADDYVTAWMERPEPYKAESEG